MVQKVSSNVFCDILVTCDFRNTLGKAHWTVMSFLLAAVADCVFCRTLFIRMWVSTTSLAHNFHYSNFLSWSCHPQLCSCHPSVMHHRIWNSFWSPSSFPLVGLLKFLYIDLLIFSTVEYFVLFTDWFSLLHPLLCYSVSRELVQGRVGSRKHKFSWSQYFVGLIFVGKSSPP